jgi:hypothetical protein
MSYREPAQREEDAVDEPRVAPATQDPATFLVLGFALALALVTLGLAVAGLVRQ